MLAFPPYGEGLPYGKMELTLLFLPALRPVFNLASLEVLYPASVSVLDFSV